MTHSGGHVFSTDSSREGERSSMRSFLLGILPLALVLTAATDSAWADGNGNPVGGWPHVPGISRGDPDWPMGTWAGLSTLDGSSPPRELSDGPTIGASAVNRGDRTESSTWQMRLWTFLRRLTWLR